MDGAITNSSKEVRPLISFVAEPMNNVDIEYLLPNDAVSIIFSPNP